jgi:hypothetical protein
MNKKRRVAKHTQKQLDCLPGTLSNGASQWTSICGVDFGPINTALVRIDTTHASAEIVSVCVFSPKNNTIRYNWVSSDIKCCATHTTTPSPTPTTSTTSAAIITVADMVKNMLQIFESRASTAAGCSGANGSLCGCAGNTLLALEQQRCGPGIDVTSSQLQYSLFGHYVDRSIIVHPSSVKLMNGIELKAHYDNKRSAVDFLHTYAPAIYAAVPSDIRNHIGDAYMTALYALNAIRPLFSASLSAVRHLSQSPHSSHTLNSDSRSITNTCKRKLSSSASSTLLAQTPPPPNRVIRNSANSIVRYLKPACSPLSAPPVLVELQPTTKTVSLLRKTQIIDICSDDEEDNSVDGDDDVVIVNK